MKIERLRSLREKRNLSQGEAAKMMGIVRTTYSNYESGNREPDNETLKKIAVFFNTTTDFLLGKDDPQKKDPQKKDAVLEAYHKLPEERKKLIDDLIKTLSNE